MQPLLAAVAFVPGLAVGSFLNVVAARVPDGRSIVKPRSACGKCGATIAAYDNVPLISYAVLRGRCRECGVKIGLIYPAVELTAAALIAACFLKFGATLHALVAAFFCTVLVTVSATDVLRRVIPNKIVLPAAAIVLAGMTIVDPSPQWAIAAAGRGRLPARCGARLPARDGHGRREARPADRSGPRQGHPRRNDGRLSRRARPGGSPDRPARTEQPAR